MLIRLYEHQQPIVVEENSGIEKLSPQPQHLFGGPTMVRFFFFQAEHGIRDGTVTGVQTCALPIWAAMSLTRLYQKQGRQAEARPRLAECRSEERRVGKECRGRWSRDHYKEKK